MRRRRLRPLGGSVESFWPSGGRLLGDGPGAYGLIDMTGVLSAADPVSFAGTDNGPAIQAVVDSLSTTITRQAVLQFPAGIFRVDTPVEINSPYVTIRGQGSGVTALHGPRWKPMFVVAPPGIAATFPSNVRPTVTGVLDNSITGKGFSTQGKYVAAGYCNASTMGGRNPDFPSMTTYDYYRTLRAFTLEVAYTGTLAPGDVILSLGDLWKLYRTGEGQYVFGFHCAGPNDVRHVETPHSIFFTPGADDGTPHKLRIAVNLASGSFAVTDRGVSASPNHVSTEALAGCYLAPNYAGYPFLIGGYGPYMPRGTTVPNVTFWGMRFSKVFRNEPVSGQDVDRYLRPNDAGTLWCLSLEDGTGRYMPLRGGDSAADAQFACLVIQDASTTLQGVQGFTLRDLMIRYASPGVLFGQSLDMSILDCEIRDGASGVDCLWAGVQYPLTVQRSQFAGIDAGLSLNGVIASLSDVIVTDFAGPYAVRTSACSVSWTNGRAWFLSPITQAIICLMGADNGGSHDLRYVLVDDEASSHPRRAMILCGKAKSMPTYLRVDGFTTVAGANTDCTVIELVGDDTLGGGINGRAQVNASGLVMTNVGTAVKVYGHGWFGTVDGSLLTTQASFADVTPETVTVADPPSLT